MFRMYDMNNLNNSPQTSTITPQPVQLPLTMGRGLRLSTSPSAIFFQTPMIPNVSQAKGGCGSCGGTR